MLYKSSSFQLDSMDIYRVICNAALFYLYPVDIKRPFSCFHTRTHTDESSFAMDRDRAYVDCATRKSLEASSCTRGNRMVDRLGRKISCLLFNSD